MGFICMPLPLHLSYHGHTALPTGSVSCVQSTELPSNECQIAIQYFRHTVNIIKCLFLADVEVTLNVGSYNSERF